MTLTFKVLSGRAIELAWFKTGIADALVARHPTAKPKSAALITTFSPSGVKIISCTTDGYRDQPSSQQLPSDSLGRSARAPAEAAPDRSDRER
jgi:hypothetical protein